MKLWTDNARKAVSKHPNCVEAGECRPQHRSRRKDRRHWCKGREGIPHTWEWVRRPDDLWREQHFGIRYNRITESPVCFGCAKVDFRFRHYCRLCGEPWPKLHHEVMLGGAWRVTSCARCGAPWSIRTKVAGVTIVSSST